MGLLRDWAFIEDMTRIPALSELVREALIKALFTRDDRVLPPAIVGTLSKTPAVTVKVKDDAEVRKLVQVLNGEESTVSLGLSAEDFHYFRRQLGVARGKEIGIAPRPRSLLTYDWLVPEPRGVQLDFSAYGSVEFPEGSARAVAQVGAAWTDLSREALANGRAVPFVPTVPLDFAIGDALWGDAPFASYEGDFGAYVLGLRTVSGYGHRTMVGFDAVSTEGSGYDLVHAILPHAAEFFLPVAVALRLVARPAARRILTYRYADGAKLAAGLEALTRSGRAVAWAHVADAGAAAALRPTLPPDPFTLQVSLAGPESGLATREKAIDALLAGFTSKASDVPDPFDLPSEAYRKTADRVGRSLFVGEVRAPVRSLADLHGKLAGLGEQVGAKASLYASVRSTGVVSAFPAFEVQKDRPRVYELSKGVHRIAKTIPGAVFASRLAHLWEDDEAFRKRMGILTALKRDIDAAQVLQPLVSP
ncbi:MAG: hypothetical protein A3K68_05820 [Euryarchaeota archaeon RBG_16_68_13]|nr:MAG: hypothetical protein A3K68_05820 [Euryarchaeota archaeon RBG_16_68_13]